MDSEEKGTAAEHETVAQETKMQIRSDGREADAAMEEKAAGAIGRRGRTSLLGTGLISCASVRGAVHEVRIAATTCHFCRRIV